MHPIFYIFKIRRAYSLVNFISHWVASLFQPFHAFTVLPLAFLLDSRVPDVYSPSVLLPELPLSLVDLRELITLPFRRATRKRRSHVSCRPCKNPHTFCRQTT